MFRGSGSAFGELHGNLSYVVMSSSQKLFLFFLFEMSLNQFFTSLMCRVSQNTAPSAREVYTCRQIFLPIGIISHMKELNHNHFRKFSLFYFLLFFTELWGISWVSKFFFNYWFVQDCHCSTPPMVTTTGSFREVVVTSMFIQTSGISPGLSEFLKIPVGGIDNLDTSESAPLWWSLVLLTESVYCKVKLF